jgi:pyrimidine deaminase RibD-like protein
MTIINDASKYEFTTMDNEKVGYYIVKDGSVVESAGYHTLETRGWWSEFKACVKEHLELMSSGSGAGTALALGCIAFGPECSAAIATYCSVEALF